MHLYRCTLAIACTLLTFASAVQAEDVRIEEAGLSMTLPAAWAAKYEKTNVPTGQLMQRWVRSPVTVGQFSASPGLIALATPVPKDANLALLSQATLGRAPHNVRLAAETECIKCVRVKFNANGGVATSISPDVPPKCTEFKPGVEADCVYQIESMVKLNLEPSWVHRFEKEAAFGKMYVLAVHVLVDEKFVDLSFFYPKDAASQIEPEIGTMVSSIKRISR